MGEEAWFLTMGALQEFCLELELRAPDVVTAFEAIWSRVLPIVGSETWSHLETSPPVTAGALGSLRGARPSPDALVNIYCELAPETTNRITVTSASEDDETLWTTSVCFGREPPAAASQPWRPAQLLGRLARDLLHTGAVVRARVTPVGYAMCAPWLPIARVADTAVLTSESEVGEHFERPESFWRSWSSVERFGEMRFCVRAEDATTSVDLLRSTQAQQWEMLRALKPGHLARPDMLAAPKPDEAAVFEEGTARLDPVGYLPNSRTVELSYARPAGDHIRGWEIQHLAEIVEEKALPDGRPVDRARVVFLERAAADIEKRALLEYGIAVFYMDAAGAAVEITS